MQSKHDKSDSYTDLTQRDERPSLRPSYDLDLGLFAARVSEVVGDIKIRAFAHNAGISARSLSEYMAGDTEPSRLALVGIARAGNVSVQWLATGYGKKELSFDSTSESALAPEDFVMVPRYDVHGSAGNGAVIHSEQIVDYLAFRANWVRNALGVAHKDLVLISVKGDSMEPTLSNGDLILVDTGARRIEDSAIYVLKNGSGLLVKRLQHKLDGTVIVKCDNDRYESEVYSAEAAVAVIVVGRVVWAGRKL
jgi:phage repressor protein C with HTH and peptisase S24 domain